MARVLVNRTSIVGEVRTYAGPTTPEGYLLCQGQAVSRITYATLYTVLGTLHGVGDGSTTFNLPDYRGVFLRGLDGGRGLDSGRVLGSYQADMFGSHTHIQNAHQHAIHGIAQQGVNGGQADDLTAGNNFLRNTELATATNQNAGGNETRPKNSSVNFIIKY